MQNEIDPQRFTLGENAQDDSGDITNENQVPMFMRRAKDAKTELASQRELIRKLEKEAESNPDALANLENEREIFKAMHDRYSAMAERRQAPDVKMSWKVKQKYIAAQESLKKSLAFAKRVIENRPKTTVIADKAEQESRAADFAAKKEQSRKARPVPVQKSDDLPLAMKSDKSAGKKTKAEIKAAIEKAMPYLKGHVEVVDSMDDLPTNIQEQLKAIGANGKERGVYAPKLDKAYVFASNNKDAGEAIVAAMHEAVGHKGVYAVLGKEKSNVLSALANSKDAGVQKVAESVRKSYGDIFSAIEAKHGKAAADAMLGAEIVARVSESNVKIPVVKRVKLMLADTLSKITGRNKVESIADVELLLKRSRDYLKSGAKPSKPTGGKPLSMKSAKDAVTDSAAFKKWFGDSKVVDKHGNPLVVYHGTQAKIDSFELGYRNPELSFKDGVNEFGFHVTASKGDAGVYAGDGGKVYELYAMAENPLDFGNAAEFTKKKFVDFLASKGVTVKIDTKYSANSVFHPYELLESTEGMRDAIKAAGYDSVMYPEGSAKTLVLFNPNQIKSAIGNNGNYDPENDSILAMRRPVDAINSITRKPAARRFTAKARAFAAKNLTKERGLTKADYSARDEALGIRMEINGVIAPKVSQAFKNEWKKLYGDEDFSKHPDVIYNTLKFMRGENATLPAELKQVAQMMRNEIDAASDKVRDVIKDRVKYSTDAMNPESLSAFNQYLAELQQIESLKLPEEIHDKRIEDAAKKAIKTARGDKNRESQAGLVAQSIADMDMVKTLEAGKGSYLNRAYQAHNDPKWRSRIIDDTLPVDDPDHIIDKRVYNAAAADIRKGNPEATDDEIYNAINTILLKADSVANPMAHLGLSSEVKKLGVFKRRKLDDMPGIRRLLGEYQNPVNIFNTTLAKQGNIISAHHFMKTMRENGLETGLMATEQGGKNQYQIQGGKGMEPLSGLWTTPEYGKVIESILEKVPAGAASRMILNVVGAVKKGKTVLSPSTAMVNLLSNFTASWRNGHIGHYKEHAQAISLMKRYVNGDQAAINTVKRLADLGYSLRVLIRLSWISCLKIK